MTRRDLFKRLLVAPIAAAIAPEIAVSAPPKPLVRINPVLLKQEWLALDQQIMLASRKRLRAWADLTVAKQYAKV